MEQMIITDDYVWSTPENTTECGIRIKLRCSGVHFEVRYLSSNLAISPYLMMQHEASMRIMWAAEEGGTEDCENSIQEMDRLRKPFETLVLQLATDVGLVQPVESLNDFLYPLHLVLDAVASTPESTAIQPFLRGKITRYIGYYLSNWQKSVKHITSRQVQLLCPTYNTRHNPCLRPSKVIARDDIGTEVVCIFKTCNSNVTRDLLLGKPLVYHQIEAAIKAKKLRPDIPVCRLYDIVVDNDRDVPQHSAQFFEEEIADWDSDSDASDHGRNSCDVDAIHKGHEANSGGRDSDFPHISAPIVYGKLVETSPQDRYPHDNSPRRIASSDGKSAVTSNGNDDEHLALSRRLIGLLLLHIENKGTLFEIAPRSDCSDLRRVRWAHELEEAINKLHAAGIVWGDAKPHNLLIDLEDRLHIIDMDGGYTAGWVDREKCETQEGDVQGVMRIKEWLLKCSERHVSCNK